MRGEMLGAESPVTVTRIIYHTSYQQQAYTFGGGGKFGPGVGCRNVAVRNGVPTDFTFTIAVFLRETTIYSEPGTSSDEVGTVVLGTPAWALGIDFSEQPWVFVENCRHEGWVQRDCLGFY